MNPEHPDAAQSSPRARIARIFDPPRAGDGSRILVDRLWPRGLSKANAQFDTWSKEVAPTSELRRWYGHRPERFEEFSHRYRDQLEDETHRDGVRALRLRLDGGETLTLLTASKIPEMSQAAVLADLLNRDSGRPAAGQ